MKFVLLFVFTFCFYCEVHGNEYKYIDTKCSSSNESFAVFYACKTSPDGASYDVIFELKQPMDNMHVRDDG